MPKKTAIKQVILDAIRNDEDLSKLSMAQISSRSSIPKSTIYEYYKSKNALLDEIFFDVVHDYILEIKSLPIESLDFEHSFKLMLKKLYEVSIKTSVLFIETIHHGAQKINQNCLESYRNVVEEKFFEIFHKLQRKDLVQERFMITSMIVGSTMILLQSQEKISCEQSSELIYQSVLKLLS